MRWLENLKQSVDLLGDPGRCIHIGDWESDIYELFCAGQAIGTHFLVRTCVDRLAGDGDHTVSTDMAKVKSRYRIEVRDANGNPQMVELDIKYERLQICPPIGKPKHRRRIDWKLVTDLPTRTLKEVIEKLRWYALRWKIEVFHKILKSGCNAEDRKLRTAERLVNLIAVFCIGSWRIFWMTMLYRSNFLVPDKSEPPDRHFISRYIIKIAKLRGYLARAGDPAPGNTVMWRGLSRLSDIELGALSGTKICG